MIARYVPLAVKGLLTLAFVATGAAKLIGALSAYVLYVHRGQLTGQPG